MTDASETPDLSPAEIAAMSRSERAALAAQYKSQGNAAYQKRDFTRAIDLYSKAIAVAAVSEAVFYSNRAACYLNLQPPEYENVVRDCDEALKLDSTYIKALNRRAGALEALGTPILANNPQRRSERTSAEPESRRAPGSPD